MPPASLLRDLALGDLHAERAPRGHRVSSVEEQVDHDLLELPRVHPHRAHLRARADLHAYVFAQQAASSCDLMLAVGTKLSVYPIAGVVPVAKRAGARVVILNAEPTEMDELADALLRGSISEILPRLVEA